MRKTLCTAVIFVGLVGATIALAITLVWLVWLLQFLPAPFLEYWPVLFMLIPVLMLGRMFWDLAASLLYGLSNDSDDLKGKP